MIRLVSLLAVFGLSLACDDEEVSTGDKGREQWCNSLVGTWESDSGNETWVISEGSMVIKTRPPEAPGAVYSTHLNHIDDSFQLTVFVTQYTLEGTEDDYSESVNPPDGPYIKPYRLYNCKLTIKNLDYDTEHTYSKK